MLFQVALAAVISVVIDAVLAPDSHQTPLLIPVVAWAVAYAQNALEDRGTIPALLKAPASPGARPLPRDAAAFERRHYGST